MGSPTFFRLRKPFLFFLATPPRLLKYSNLHIGVKCKKGTGKRRLQHKSRAWRPNFNGENETGQHQREAWEEGKLCESSCLCEGGQSLCTTGHERGAILFVPAVYCERLKPLLVAAPVASNAGSEDGPSAGQLFSSGRISGRQKAA